MSFPLRQCLGQRMGLFEALDLGEGEKGRIKGMDAYNGASDLDMDQALKLAASAPREEREEPSSTRLTISAFEGLC